MLHAVLLMGQSNMAGRGNLDDVAPICDRRIKMMRNGLWVPMIEPIQCDKPWAGVSLAASYAEAWLEDHPDEEIGLIPCAHGGTTLDQWSPGSCLYDNAVNLARLAMRTATLDAILWHQGESDSTDEAVSVYYDKLRNIVDSLRNDLSAQDTPFLIGGLGGFLRRCHYLGCSRNYQRLNDIFQQFAREEHDSCYVYAEDLQERGDAMHFSAVSQRILGRRFYAAYHTGTCVTQALEGEADYAARCQENRMDEQHRYQYVIGRLYDSQL